MFIPSNRDTLVFKEITRDINVGCFPAEGQPVSAARARESRLTNVLNGTMSARETPATMETKDDTDTELQDLLSDKTASRFKVARVSISDLAPAGRDRGEVTRLTPTMEHNSYVYDTRNSKSLAQLTREALPRAEHYRDIIQGKHACRPTLEELHEARFLEKFIEDIVSLWTKPSLTKVIGYFLSLSRFRIPPHWLQKYLTVEMSTNCDGDSTFTGQFSASRGQFYLPESASISLAFNHRWGGSRWIEEVFS
ncbi:hypothetical protein J6590_025689 [Homalodisca vitripennis]|nr:hypothetical protein J6590_025689 [Homalodisca vitripennis]